jgi:hypothetical protein
VQGEITPEITKERQALPDLVRQAAPLFRRLGKPISRQHKIEFWVEGVEVPIIGYADYTYDDFVIDLKTTFALPSKPRPDDAVQVVMYGDALHKRPGLIGIPASSEISPNQAIGRVGSQRRETGL